MRIQYEDLCDNLEDQVQKMLEFLGLNSSAEMQAFIASHTQEKKYDREEVSRDTQQMSRAWMKTSRFEKVKEVQDLCNSSIQQLSYALFRSEDEFNGMVKKLFG